MVSLKKKSCTLLLHSVENIRCQNKLRAKFCFTLKCFTVKPNFLKGKTLYFGFLFRKTLFFIQNKHVIITSAINPPLETILPIRITIHGKNVTQIYKEHMYIAENIHW